MALFKAKVPAGKDKPTYVLAEVDRLKVQFYRDDNNGDIHMWVNHPELAYPGDPTGSGIWMRLPKGTKSYRNVEHLLKGRGVQAA